MQHLFRPLFFFVLAPECTLWHTMFTSLMKVCVEQYQSNATILKGQ